MSRAVRWLLIKLSVATDIQTVRSILPPVEDWICIFGQCLVYRTESLSLSNGVVIYVLISVWLLCSRSR